MTEMRPAKLSVEESIQWMTFRLEELGFQLEEVNWNNPVPHIWSVELRDSECEVLKSLGKGTTPEAAKASALGGFIERLATNHYFANYYLGTEIAHREFVHHPAECWFKATSKGLPPGLLDSYCRDHFDPQEQLCGDQLVDLNSSNEVRGVCALPFIRQSDGEKVWFPVNLINNLFDSNGMAAGNTAAEARVQAISEVYERHVKATIIANGIALPRIPPKVIAQHSRVEAAIKALRVKGFVVDVRDASLGGKYPLVSVTLFDRTSTGALTAFGANPKFAVALERALTTLLQGRQLEDLAELPELSFNLSDAARAENLTQHILKGEGTLCWDMFSDQSDYPYTEWNIEGSAEEEFTQLVQRIHSVDMQIYLAEYSHLGIPVCRILVPGMSEIKPVGALVWQNNNAIIPLRPLIKAAPTLSEEELLDLLDELEEVHYSGTEQLADILGYPSEAGVRKSLHLAEFKLMLALALGDAEILQGMLAKVLSLPGLSAEQRRLYQLISHMIEIELDPNRKQIGFERVFQAVYGPELYELAKAKLRGKGVFEPFLELVESLTRSPEYQTLLSKYRKACATA
jgi:ribosomal protein S12 methylthiotransferase accessory factor